MTVDSSGRAKELHVYKSKLLIVQSVTNEENNKGHRIAYSSVFLQHENVSIFMMKGGIDPVMLPVTFILSGTSISNMSSCSPNSSSM